MTAYFAGFFAAVSLPVGALVFLMVGILARASWLVPMRRAVEALVMTLPLFFVFYVPIALRLADIYPWMNPASQVDPNIRASLEHAHVWLSPAFFVARAYVYMSVWLVFAFALRRVSLQDKPGEKQSVRLRKLSAAGLPAVLTTASFAGFDWLMSLQPGWTSDAFGLYVAAGSFAGAMGALCIILCFARKAEFLAESTIKPDHVHAIGRVLLVSVLLWAYVGFCQFLLIWIADLPSEIPFYQDRGIGSWRWVSAALVTLGLVCPFSLLLSRAIKRSLSALASVGAIVLAAHVLDVLWIVIPSTHRDLRVLDFVPALVFLVVVGWITRGRYRAVPALPVHDSDLARGLEYESP